MQAPAFRARSVPELLDAAFQVLRARYPQILTAALVTCLPAFVLGLVIPPEARVVATLAHSFLLAFAMGATVVIVSDAYLGQDRSLAEVLRAVFSRFGSILGVAVTRHLQVSLGLVLLVVPGVIAYIVTFAMVPVVLIEGASRDLAFERSRALARGQWGRILATQALGLLLMYMAYFGMVMLVNLVSGLVGGIGETAATLLPQLFLTVLYPLPATIAALLYYDARIRNEAFDIQMLMAQAPGLEHAVAPAPAA